MKRRTISPISAKISIGSPGPMSPGTAGPRIAPAAISPINEGKPALSSSSPRPFAVTRRRRMTASGLIRVMV